MIFSILAIVYEYENPIEFISSYESNDADSGFSRAWHAQDYQYHSPEDNSYEYENPWEMTTNEIEYVDYPEEANEYYEYDSNDQEYYEYEQNSFFVFEPKYYGLASGKWQNGVEYFEVEEEGNTVEPYYYTKGEENSQESYYTYYTNEYEYVYEENDYSYPFEANYYTYEYKPL